MKDFEDATHDQLSDADAELFKQQSRMLAEYKQGLDVAPIDFKPDSARFLVPASAGRVARVVVLAEGASKEKRLIFSALYTAYYIAYVLNSDQALGYAVSDITPRFVGFLNNLEIATENRISIFKLYEITRVKENQVKTQSTGLRELIRIVNKALAFEPFGLQFLSHDEYRFLDQLSKTKPAAKDETEQSTLTEWFGFHSWLRLEEVGIGEALFNRISSPKLLTKSLQVSCSAALVELHRAKHALIDLFTAQELQRNTFPSPPSYPDVTSYSDGSKDLQYKKDIAQFKKQTLHYKKQFLERLGMIFPDSKDANSSAAYVAMQALIYSQCTRGVIDFVIKQVGNRASLQQQVTNHGKIQTIFRQQTPQCMLFTPEFILELVDYAAKHSTRGQVPVSRAEHYLFSTLMAFQTVAVTDIFRLKISNFKFLRRQNGNITHIDCEYFKSRAHVVHSTNMVDASSVFGEAILAFINDRTAKMSMNEDPLVIDDGISKLKTGKMSIAATLFRFLTNSTIREKIDITLSREKSSPVFLEAVNKVLENGVDKEEFTVTYKGNAENWMVECKTPTKVRLFGLENIKNSSVHAASDDFDASRLMNYRSHSMETERQSYLTKENEVWLNNCGRVTRAVMHDLQCNVFRPSSADKMLFQSDFTKAIRFVEHRKLDVLTRLKVISEKEQGEVDDLGFSTRKAFIDGELPDSLFLVESPDTVMKLKHYMNELNRTHEQLAKVNPDFLFYTALPTVEWIEGVFSNRLFSSDTVYEGEVLYKKLQAHLPLLFSVQLGGNPVGK
ncbi:hypothetical protein [Shewanella sp.]|uniref:hypothetical protein n=1 Tax=Shewanella sp. TaxID=50422 RepID=UPI004053F00F